MPTPNRRPLIYSLTRLVSRQHSNTPTGIDRIDLQHAQFMLGQASSRKIIFVIQQRDFLHLMPIEEARKQLSNLWQRWVQSKPLRPLPAASRAQRLHRWLKMRAARARGIFLDTALLRALSGQPRPIFLNSSHGGVHHQNLHEHLKQHLEADVLFYLHDLIPIDYPEYTNHPSEPATHHKRLLTMAHTATQVLVNSHHTRQRFLDFCLEHELPAPTVAVLHIGVEQHFIDAKYQPLEGEPLSQLAPPASYFVTIGTIEPRKNHLFLLQIWRTLTHELGEACPYLVIVGKRGWKNENVVSMLERTPSLQQRVIELNQLNDRELVALLQHAKAVLLPSFAEGWGMPLAEALTLRTPAICSDIATFHECSQEQATFLDPLDGPAWKAAIKDFQTPAPAQYIPPTWQAHLGQLKQIITSLDAEGSPHGDQLPRLS